MFLTGINEELKKNIIVTNTRQLLLAERSDKVIEKELTDIYF